LGWRDWARRRGCRRPAPGALRSGSLGGEVRAAARHSGGVHKFRIKCIAVLRTVSAGDVAVGNRLSGRAMPTTAITRPGPSALGHNATATTGASIGARILNTARAIAMRRDGGNAIAGSARRGLQRWTCRRHFRVCPQELTGSCRRRRDVCKDRRVDRGNDFDIKAIPRHGRRFAKDDVIGAAAPTCYGLGP
jgi:hypothetical protein